MTSQNPALTRFQTITAGHGTGPLFVHTEEVTGSIPVPPTLVFAGQRVIAFTSEVHFHHSRTRGGRGSFRKGLMVDPLEGFVEVGYTVGEQVAIGPQGRLDIRMA
jgi:hypothetical protein